MKKARLAAFSGAVTAVMLLAAAGLKLPQIGGETSQNGFLPQVGAGPGNGEAAPPDVVRDFVAAMAAGDDNPNLEFYSAASKLMLRGLRATPGQMRRVVETYNRCGQAESFGGIGVAVERYPAGARTCPPVLLFRENSRWVLDLATAAGVIRFNDSDEWHFSGGIPKGYAFAFEDWVLDENGYPHPAPSDDAPASPGDMGTY